MHDAAPWKLRDLTNALQEERSGGVAPTPVVVAKIPFSTVFLFVIYFTIAQAIVGGTILATLFLLGVL